MQSNCVTQPASYLKGTAIRVKSLSKRAFSIASLILLATAAFGQPYLILHDLPHAHANPTFLRTNYNYINTLPIDGLFVYVDAGGTNITGSAMQPSPISFTTIENVLAPFKGLTWSTMKRNFGLLYWGPGWPDLYDDSKWAIVSQNMANYARALREAGLVGVAFDNENYSRYGNYGDPTCGSPRTRQECQAKMVQRGAQVMQAMIAQFPTIEVLFFMDTHLSDKTFYQRPEFRFVNDIAFANLLVGPFTAGAVQATVNTSAQVVLGGENPGFEAKTPQAFNEVYQYQKFGVVNNALHPTDSESRAAGQNGWIPSSLRPLWPNLVSAGVAVYNMNNIDTRNNMPTTLQSTITHALNRVDKYVWLYMETWSPDANPPHPTMLIPPGSGANAAPQAWVDAVRAGRAAAQGGPLAISSATVSSVTSNSAVITWATNKVANSAVEHGTTTAYGQTTSVASQVTSHAVTLSGLQPGTSYNVRAKSMDAAGWTALSGNLVLKTSGTAPSQPTSPPATPSGTFLSDRTPTLSNNGWGPVEKDRSNGEAAAGDGRTLSIRGVQFSKGIGVHAPSDLRYNLGGVCNTFTATVGIDDEVAPNGSVVFQVFADGTKIFDSGVVTAAMAGRAVNVSVVGKSELRLVVTDAGNGIDYDHADWANAQVDCSSGGVLSFLSDRTPTMSTNGYGPMEKDRSNGENGAGDGRVMSIRGVQFSKGLGVHAASEIRYALSGRCTTFAATVGIDDEVGPNGSVAFQVWTDGTMLYDSGRLTATSAAKDVNVGISGRNELRLVVTNGGDNIDYDHANWANARVVCQ